MQKRVEELVLEAGFKTELWNNPYPYTVYKEDHNNPGSLERFAEALIRECAAVALREEHEPSECILHHFELE